MKKFLRENIYWLYVVLQFIFDEFRYLKNLLFFKNIRKKFHFKLKSDIETVDEIVFQKKSLARFGDGEFKWMLGIKQISFQDDNLELKNRLIEVFNSTDTNLLIGIPKSFDDISEYNHNAKRYWINFIFKYYKLLKINADKEYVNASITRPYIDYKNKKNSKNRFENLKRIWNDRNVVIVEGEKSKLGVGNDLFDNAKKIKRIICPSKNAFSKYNEILEACEKLNRKDLILISLGPTATVLAYDLCKKGYQALDIGHIDIEYEWFKSNAKSKKNVNGKSTNEVIFKRKVSNLLDEDGKYQKQITKRICI